ncbi:MAG: DUF1810 domain-containing protein [bacterium]|nr:DUF1810 domain-containing protein [bacterium]
MNPESQDIQADPFRLSRFVEAQRNTYSQALAELRRGRKESHWMWFIFPQIDGLGRSTTAKHYAIKSKEEAVAYLNHSTLGARLLECCNTILEIRDRSASEIFGFPDDMKLRSCVTLFAAMDDGDSVFTRVLDRYFDGEVDLRTIEILNCM